MTAFKIFELTWSKEKLLKIEMVVLFLMVKSEGFRSVAPAVPKDTIRKSVINLKELNKRIFLSLSILT